MTSQHSPAAATADTAAQVGGLVVQFGEVRDIPLNRLKASPKNARRVGHSAEVIESRAASISYKGVLQPLVVEPEIKDGKATGYYLVSAGEGRRQALRLLAKRKALAKAAPVRCVVDTTNDPAEVSMDENLSREPRLTGIVLKSFAGLGLKASAAGASADDFLRPGKLAALGIDACKPILQAAGDLGGFPGFFENIVQILILLIVALFVLVSFFVIAVQVFVVLIEFKLVSLAGFVLVPFGLFGRTAFLAEKVLGNVIASGVKVMVLAVIVGIGSSLFTEFSNAPSGQPTLEEVLAMALAALTLLGLSIFGPGIASGLVSGAPQLGAGAAVGTGLAVGGMAMAGAAAAQMAAAGPAALRTGLTGAGAAGSGGAPAPPSGGSGPPPSSPTPGGPIGPSSPTGGGGAAAAPTEPSAARRHGGDPGEGGGGQGAGGDGGGAPDAPAWARELQHQQALAHGAGMAMHAVASGDGSSGGTAPSLKED